MADVVYSLTINGVERDNLLASCSLRLTNGNVSTLDFAVDSEDASYRPEIDDVVIFSENGTARFKGAITSAYEEAHGGPALDSIVTRCSAASQEVVLTYRFVTITIPAGSTLKDALELIDADAEAYFSGYGLTIAAGQANGPTFAADVVFTDTRLDEVIRKLAEISGYIPEVSADDEIEMYAPGSRSAPGNLTAGASDAVHQVGDVKIEPTKNDTYINRIKLKITGAGPATHSETITFDGSPTLDYQAAYPAPTDANTVWPNVILLNGGPSQGSIGFNDGSSAWEWVTAENTRARLVLDGTGLVPNNGDTFVITYEIAYPFEVIRENLGSPPAPIREIILTQPEGMTLEGAIEYADSLLGRKSTVTKLATWDSYTLGWAPGQSLTINLPKRNTNATFLITDVVMRPEVTTDENGDLVKFRYEMTALEGDVDQGNWRETPKSWLGGGNVQAGTLQATGGGARPGGSIYSVQAHGASHDFYGDDQVLHDFDEGGDSYGSINKKARFAVGVSDEDLLGFALWNAIAGKSKAFTCRLDDNGSVNLRVGHTDVGTFDLEAWDSGTAITLTARHADADIQLSGRKIEARNVLHKKFGEGISPLSITTTHTVDVTQSNPYSLLKCDTTSGGFTLTLPAHAGIQVVDGTFRRTLYILNIGANTLTIAPNTSQTINGSGSNLTIVGLGGKILQLGDSGAWHELANTGGGSGTVSVDTAQGLDGDGSGGDPLVVKVDGVTVGFNGSGELEVIGGGSPGGSPSGGGGDFVFIEEQTPSGVGTITFSSLGSYTHLELRYAARSSQSANFDGINLRFNGDTGANYDAQSLFGVNTTPGAGEGIAATSLGMGAISAATSASGNVGAGTLNIYDYRGTTFHKAVVLISTRKDSNASAGTVVNQLAGAWRSTSAITSITILLSAGNFDAGSKFTLYGLT